jgi:hypothetical protein
MLNSTTPQNITLHLKALFEESELEEGATCKDYLQVRAGGEREVWAVALSKRKPPRLR